ARGGEWGARSAHRASATAGVHNADRTGRLETRDAKAAAHQDLDLTSLTNRGALRQGNGARPRPVDSTRRTALFSRPNLILALVRSGTPAMSDRLTEDVTKFQGRFAALKAEVGKVLVGQDEMLHRLLLGLLAGGHV